MTSKTPSFTRSLSALLFVVAPVAACSGALAIESAPASNDPFEGGAARSVEASGDVRDASSENMSIVDASADAFDANSIVDANACEPRGDGTCGPNPLCCPAVQGFRFHEDQNCLETTPTALSCPGIRPCIPPGQITGCLMRNGEVFYLTEGDSVPPPGFNACSPGLYTKVRQAPRDAGCGK